MTTDEYKDARARSGIGVLELWCRTIEISEDTHKSISAGRLAVSDAVQGRIGAYFTQAKDRAEALRDQLSKVLSKTFEGCRVSLDQSTLDIAIKLPDGREHLALHHGVDAMNGWGVYQINCGRGRQPLLLLHARSPNWKKSIADFDWYMWRGPFSGTQSYWNNLDAKLLAECLKTS